MYNVNSSGNFLFKLSLIKKINNLLYDCLLQNIQKMLGFAPSRAASKQGGGLFGTAPQLAK